MKGHWIARIDVTEEALYPEYGKRALSAISKFGRRFAVRSGAARHRGADFKADKCASRVGPDVPTPYFGPENSGQK